jgi:DNA-directed RNA polymerase subunit RPC12/RpoP
MATSVSYRCGGCRKKIGREASALFYPIGVPYIQCPHCGSPNIRSASVNEWDLMTWWLKLRCFGEVTLVGSFFGAAAGSAVFEIVLDRLGPSRLGNGWAGFALILGIALGIAVMSQWLRSRIRKSRERLSDQSYGATLLHLGIASGTVRRLSPGPARSAGTNYADTPVSEVVRDCAASLRDFYEKHRDKLPGWKAGTWRLVGIGIVVVAYALAFAVQSVRAEKYCLRDAGAISFYVSPWTLSRYCTMGVSGREYTFEAEGR